MVTSLVIKRSRVHKMSGGLESLLEEEIKVRMSAGGAVFTSFCLVVWKAFWRRRKGHDER